jgi:hypothetical protein
MGAEGGKVCTPRHDMNLGAVPDQMCSEDTADRAGSHDDDAHDILPAPRLRRAGAKSRPGQAFNISRLDTEQTVDLRMAQEATMKMSVPEAKTRLTELVRCAEAWTGGGPTSGLSFWRWGIAGMMVVDTSALMAILPGEAEAARNRLSFQAPHGLWSCKPERRGLPCP